MRRRLSLSLLAFAVLLACSRPDKKIEKSNVDLERPVKGTGRSCVSKQSPTL